GHLSGLSRVRRTAQRADRCRRPRGGRLPDRRRCVVGAGKPRSGRGGAGGRFESNLCDDRDLRGCHRRAADAAAASRFRWGVLPMKRLTPPFDLALAVTVLVSTAFTVAVTIPAANVHAAQQVPADEQQALRARIEQRYDVVPLSGGVALRPKSPRDDVRLIEISDTIAINGVPVSGRELRERIGADADAILRLSYLDAKALVELFGPVAAEREIRPEKEAPLEPAAGRSSRRIHRSGG